MDPPANAEKAADDFPVVQQAVPVSVRLASANARQEAAGHSQVFSRAGGQRRNHHHRLGLNFPGGRAGLEPREESDRSIT